MASTARSGVSTGLVDRFGPERVRNTPISEAAIIGAALGAALTGCRPIAELMFIDLIGVGDGPDHEPGGQGPLHVRRASRRVPLVIRTARRRRASALAGHHSQSLEACWCTSPA